VGVVFDDAHALSSDITAPLSRTVDDRATPTGLPVGIQIIGPLFEDDTPIAFAELLAELTRRLLATSDRKSGGGCEPLERHRTRDRKPIRNREAPGHRAFLA
jgi:hypothetical protein